MLFREKEHSDMVFSTVCFGGWKMRPCNGHRIHRNQANVGKHTVDGRNPANQLRLIVYLSIYRVFSTIPGGCWGVLPSTIPSIHPMGW